jgi:peptidoglycan/xylan/chitin deacetylase (PgdA/CDA1 family)
MFAAQLRVIREHCNVVPLIDILERDASGEIRAAVTFDDAYASALKLGVTECRRQNVPCTVFVAPSLLGTIPYWDVKSEREQWSIEEREHFLTVEKGIPPEASVTPFDQNNPLRIASEEEIREAVCLGGVTLGNHTFNHINLRAHSPDAIVAELRQSQDWLRAHFPEEVTLPIVAYPYGYPPLAAEDYLGASVNYGLLADGGWMISGSSRQRAMVPRWNVSPMPLARFTVRLGGCFRRISGPSRFVRRGAMIL